MTCPLPQSPSDLIVADRERRDAIGSLPLPNAFGRPFCQMESPTLRASWRLAHQVSDIGSSLRTSPEMSDPQLSRELFVERLTASSPDPVQLSHTSSRTPPGSPTPSLNWGQDQYNETIRQTGTVYGNLLERDNSSPSQQGNLY